MIKNYLVVCSYLFVILSFLKMDGALSSSKKLPLRLAYFGPPIFGKDIYPVLQKLIFSEEESIFIAMYGLTHPDIVTALLAARKLRELQITCLVDPLSLAGKGQVKRLVDEGCDVHSYAGPGLMHNKIWLFGKNHGVSLPTNQKKSKGLELLVTGSANVTPPGIGGINQEHILYGHDPESSALFKKAFQKLIQLRCVALKPTEKRKCS